MSKMSGCSRQHKFQNLCLDLLIAVFRQFVTRTSTRILYRSDVYKCLFKSVCIYNAGTDGAEIGIYADNSITYDSKSR